MAAAMVCSCVAVQADADEPHSSAVLLFAGSDIWRDGAFLYGGSLWSPAGLDADGFTGIR